MFMDINVSYKISKSSLIIFDKELCSQDNFCIISLSKFKEKRGKQTDSIVHIEEILRKHGGDLEKKIQVLELENKEYIDENKSLEQR